MNETIQTLIMALLILSYTIILVGVMPQYITSVKWILGASTFAGAMLGLILAYWEHKDE